MIVNKIEISYQIPLREHTINAAAMMVTVSMALVIVIVVGEHVQRIPKHIQRWVPEMVWQVDGRMCADEHMCYDGHSNRVNIPAGEYKHGTKLQLPMPRCSATRCSLISKWALADMGNSCVLYLTDSP